MTATGKRLAMGLVLAGAGLVPAGILAMWAYLDATAIPLHPDPHAAPSLVDDTPGTRGDEAAAAARQRVRAALSEQNLPGLSVAVGMNGAILWAEGFGWADLEEREPVAPDTRFRIGTASTMLTAAGVGLLLEDERLQLDAPIQTYVPQFPDKEWPVTLRQVMGHTAGVRSDGGDEGPLLSTRCTRPAEALPVFADRSLLFAPGTDYRESSYGWILASAAVEAVTGEPFLTFMRKRVFEPLGMDDTRPDFTAPPFPRRATSYFPRFAADPRYGLHLMREVDYSCYAGAGAFLSTPSDLVRFGMAIARGALLRPATVALLQTPQTLASGATTGYGLGWDLETVTLAGQPTVVIGHDGDLLGGMVASLMIFPSGLVVSVLSNTSYADTASVALAIAEAFAAAPLTRP